MISGEAIPFKDIAKSNVKKDPKTFFETEKIGTQKNFEVEKTFEYKKDLETRRISEAHKNFKVEKKIAGPEK